MLTNQNILALLDERIAEIARTVFLECDGNGKASVHSSDDASAKLREQIAFIKAKEHVTVKEAALLLSCSQSHIRKRWRWLARAKLVGPFLILIWRA